MGVLRKDKWYIQWYILHSKDFIMYLHKKAIELYQNLKPYLFKRICEVFIQDLHLLKYQLRVISAIEGYNLWSKNVSKNYQIEIPLN